MLYLECLIALSDAKTIEQKNYYFERLKAMAPHQLLRMHEVDSYKALGNPLHSIILEMTELPGFKAKAEWIQDRLRFQFSQAEIQDVLERLLELGLVTKGKNGVLKKLISTSPIVRT